MIVRTPDNTWITRREVALRHTSDEVTIALVKAEIRPDVSNETLLTLIQHAVTSWVQTTNEGRRAWEESDEDFNIGDLVSYYKNPELRSLMLGTGLWITNIETLVDLTSLGNWDFD